VDTLSREHERAPGARRRVPPPGILGTSAIICALAGTFLWLLMLAGPLRLATGMLDSAAHLQQAERRLSAGKVREARYETLAGAAAAARARTGLARGGPLLDLARVVPQVDDALGEVDHLVRAAELSSEAAVGTLEVADDALRGGLVAKDPDNPQGGSIVDLERIREIGHLVSDIRATIGRAAGELEAIDLTALPRRARPRITDGIAKAKEADLRLADAEAGFAILPGILGADGPRTYLIGFQNPSEQRGTGGAILQFSTLEMDAGRLTLGEGRTDKDAAATVYEIDRNRRQYDIPLPPGAFYVAGIPDAQRFGNSNWSPDWPTSADLMIDYAEAAAAANPGKIEVPELDGFIVVDPIAVEKMMAGVGPFRTRSGNRITAGNIVRFVLYRAYGVYPIPEIRRAVLRQVVQEFFGKAIKPPQPSELAAGMGDALTEKHVQVWMKDAAEQAFIEHMKWDGGIRRAENSDYLYVVEQNVGGNKLDYFAQNSTEMNIEIDGTDAVVSTEARIANEMFQPQPRWINGDSGPFHKPMMNIYVPGNAELLDAQVTGTREDTPPPAVWAADGVPPTHFEAGKTVWSATLVIAPQEEGAFRVDYRVPDVVKARDDRSIYRLVVQHQPRVNTEQLSIRLALPEGARAVTARGWKRDGDVLVWEKPLNVDIELEVSWRS
jgi:hypothetical protein